MTKIKIGGQRYDLEELPESFRNRIKSELDKEGIKYDTDNDKIKGDESVNRQSEDNVGKKDKKKEDNVGKKDKKKPKNMSIFRKMFGYP